MKKNIKIMLFGILTIVLFLVIFLVLKGYFGNDFLLVDNNSIPSENSSVKIYHDPTQMPDPSSGYCYALGYNSRVEENEKGQYGICIFPDKSECSEWAFYRGKCGQEWSYCRLKGYDLKNLTDDEGWSYDGSICVNNSTGEEIGNVYNLVNEEYVLQKNKG